jgi:hypothetical protein
MRSRGRGSDESLRSRPRAVPEMWVGSLGAHVPRPGDHVQARGEVHPEAQTRVVSLIESVVNVGSGFILSLILWQFVLAPWFGYEVTMTTNLQLTSVFTAVSVARGYLWRRFFARGLHLLLIKKVGK